MKLLRSLSFFFSSLAILLGIFLLPAAAQQFSPRLYEDMRWRLIGPFRGGRTVAIAGIPAQPNVFYFAATNGGVWKSNDYGRVWKPIFDGQPTGSVGAIALAPSDPNIIYVGSGEGLQRPDLSTGDGIYKSTDGGKTWQHLGLRNGQQITAVLVDPRNPDRVFVAVLGHPYGPNPERGVFRSTDGGATWEKVLYKDEDTGAFDLAFDPSNPRTLYAVLFAGRRPPWTTGNTFNGPGSGLYKSTDGGTTWQKLTKGLPGSAQWPAQGLGRIGIGIAPSDPSRIYALVDAGSLSGVYRSDDGGASWQRTSSEKRVAGRGSDFAWVRVDPRDPNTLYVVNTSTYRSTDGGRTFTAIKGAPGGDDYHSIWINPDNPEIILLGSDQGATITVNGGETWSSWYNQPTAQFYHVITDNQFPYWVYGAQQESGSAGTTSRSDYGAITFRDWHPIGGEEYGYVAPDPLDPNIIYSGKVSRFNHLTGESQDVSPVVLRTRQYRFNRTAPLIFSPIDPHVLYLGSNVLFATKDDGKNWQIISPDLTRDDPERPPSLGQFDATGLDRGKHRGVVYTIAPSFKDARLIWVGTDDGLIHVTPDGGGSWREVTPPELTPWSKVAMIEASHYDAATAYAAVTRFRLDDLHPYIYRTHDGGKTWQRITKGLPEDAPVNVVREDPVRKGLLFAGTERAVYVSFNDGDEWQSLQLNLPATSMRDLTIHGDDLVVGTHGRSFWILDDITPLRQINVELALRPVSLFLPQVAYRVRRNKNLDTPLPPEEPAGKNPPDGAIIDYYLDYYLQSPIKGQLLLEILDASGNLVRRFSSNDQLLPKGKEDKEDKEDKELNVPTYWIRPQQLLSEAAGMHRFVWDLHYPPPDALDHEYPISAIFRDTPRGPMGPRALPGQYVVKLTAGGRVYSESLTLKIDPRVRASQAELAQQFDLESRITAATHRDYQALQEVRALRKQIKTLMSQAAGLSDALKALDRKASAFEEEDLPYGTTHRGDSLVGVNNSLISLLANVDSADAAPTPAAIAAFAELEEALNNQLRLWEELKREDIQRLNVQLGKEVLPVIKFAEDAPTTR